MSSGASRSRPVPSKTLATWLAVLLGAFGAHRFYLHGWRDPAAWLFPLPTTAGLAGVVRMANLGQDDRAAWVLVPMLGVMLSVAMLSAIVLALTPDERWAARFAPGLPPTPTRWGPVLGAIVALMVGGAVAMGTLAFAGQKFFEWQQSGAGAASTDDRRAGVRHAAMAR